MFWYDFKDETRTYLAEVNKEKKVKKISTASHLAVTDEITGH